MVQGGTSEIENFFAPITGKMWTKMREAVTFLLHSLLHQTQDAVPAGTELCGGGLLASSISSSISALIAGDESAAVFKKGDVGEQMVRLLTPGSARRDK